MNGSSARKTRGPRPCAILTALLLAAAAGCSTNFGTTIRSYFPTYIGTTPKSFLNCVRTEPDPNIRYIAYSRLGHTDLYDDPADKTEAVKTLVAKLDEGREPLAIRAVIIRTLGNLGDRRARNAIARVANNANAEAMLKVEAYRALGKVGTAEDAMLLARIMNTDPLEDSRIAAIEGIGALKAQDPRIYHVLIEGMEHEDPAIRLESYRALKKITGKDFGNLPKDWRRELEPQVAKSDQPSAAAVAAAAPAAAAAPSAAAAPAASSSLPTQRR